METKRKSVASSVEQAKGHDEKRMHVTTENKKTRNELKQCVPVARGIFGIFRLAARENEYSTVRFHSTNE